MGVELGKVLAKNILAQLEKPEDVKGHDSSVRDHQFDVLFCERALTSIWLSTDHWLDSLLPEAPQGVKGIQPPSLKTLNQISILYRRSMFDHFVSQSIQRLKKPQCCCTRKMSNRKLLYISERVFHINDVFAFDWRVATK